MGDADWLAVAPAVIAREAWLFAAIGFLIGGIDDLAVDLLWLREKWRGRMRPIPVRTLRPHPRSLAIFVPAWDESEVIGAMLGHMTAAFGESGARIFVGAYPNDRATIDAVAAVAERDPRVRLVVLERDGPTTKADCLNGLWHALRREEWRTGRRFAGVVLHDAEDIVHRDELRVLGAMLIDHHAAQLPVRPLAVPGSPIISGHYCDEFAEAHQRMLPVRQALGAALPLAGVGCAIRRDVLAAMARRRDGNPFDASSLTEDYELGLAVARAGGTVAFARAVDDSGDLVAVRAYFPSSITTSVRQKARWMTGIALAGWDRTGWGGRASISEWWMRMRDRRALLAVTTLVAAYVGLVAHGIAMLSAALIGGQAPAPGALLGQLLGVTALLLAWRIAVRIACVWQGYGARDAALALPRLITGNIVAMLAARRALVAYLKLLRGNAPHWDKTAHAFPTTVPAAD